MAQPAADLDDLLRLDCAHVLHPITEFRQHERSAANETKEPFPNFEDPHRIVAAAFERGLIARALFQCVALAPPLIATRADVDRMVGILEAVWPAAGGEILC